MKSLKSPVNLLGFRRSSKVYPLPPNCREDVTASTKSTSPLEKHRKGKTYYGKYNSRKKDSGCTCKRESGVLKAKPPDHDGNSEVTQCSELETITSTQPSLVSTECKLLSTTAHFLSLLDQDDIQNMNRNNLNNSKQRICEINTTKQKVPMFTFQLYGNNGIKIVREIFLANGWIEADYLTQTDVKLIWSDNLLQVNVWDFKEGHQLLNHIPNTHLLSNKLFLLRCLQEYNSVKKNGLGIRMSDFVPETYRLDLKNDRILYCRRHKVGELWICKPSTLNQGKGIFLVRNSDDLSHHLKQIEAEETLKNHFSKPVIVRIIQKYISSPLLLCGRKADIRAYMILASVRPFVVLYREGYARLSCNEYSLDCEDLQTHLTNQCMQKKNPNYEVMKEDTVWEMKRLTEYVTKHFLVEESLPDKWLHNNLQTQMCHIMLHCFHAVKTKLDRRSGLFEIMGFDFLVDSSLKVWLLEINTNPSLQVNCHVLRKVIPAVLDETIRLSVECLEKSKTGVRILPLQTKKESVLLYCEEMPFMKTVPNPIPPSRLNSKFTLEIKPE